MDGLTGDAWCRVVFEVPLPCAPGFGVGRGVDVMRLLGSSVAVGDIAENSCDTEVGCRLVTVVV